MVASAKYLAALATAVALLTSCAGLSSAPPTATNALGSTAARAQGCPCLYVSIPYSPAYPRGALTVYRLGRYGDVRPIQQVAGTATGLSTPADVAADSSRNMYVANLAGNTVTVYAAGATGDVAPIQTITGSKTGLASPFGIALNPLNKDIYVTNKKGGRGGGSITVYPHKANGNAAPLQTIAGSQTRLHAPVSLALDPKGNIYVPNLNSSSVTVYAAGARGNVSPIATISGSNTKLNGPYQVALDAGLNIYVANYWPPFSVTVYAAGSNGNVAPMRMIQGAATKLNGPDGVALDASGSLYVANYTGNSIGKFAAGSNGNVKPTNQIKGQRTGVVCPSGMVVF